MNPQTKNYLNLILGVAFVGYGSYRLISYFQGAELSNFRIVIAVGFVLLGAYDLFKFFSSLKS